MARGAQWCPGDALGRLAWFRQEWHWCLWRCGDALFELADAVLTAPGLVASLPYLSLEPAFRRGHRMIYQALGEGGIDEEALRDLLVAARPRDWPLAFAIDASTYPRPEAESSPDREFHHHADCRRARPVPWWQGSGRAWDLRSTPAVSARTRTSVMTR
jgi:hypothetical protein